MRIVHVITSLDLEQGGPPVVALNLARAQSALGHKVAIAAESGTAEKPLNTIQLAPHTIRDLARPTRPAVASMVSTADILHLHGVWEPLLCAVARCARQLRRPYVITAHGMLDPWSLQQKKWKKRIAFALGYRQMLNRAATLHALNADERDLLKPLGLSAPCEVIPNGVFLDDFEPSPDPARFRQLPRGPKERKYILFLSRLHYKKGLDLLAEAFRQIAPRHPDIDLVVAGPDGGEESNFCRHIEEAGLANRVWLTGPLYGADKLSCLAGAAAFCLPSRQEGFSVAILEALACRVPVVITENCHFPEVAEVGAGRVVPLEAGQVASGLDAVLSDATAAQAMGAAGRALVEERFTWPRVAKRLVALYERLVKHPTGAVS